ncbi:hypothetical protein EJB05_29712, partial [Eragrostis curvula]
MSLGNESVYMKWSMALNTLGSMPSIFMWQMLLGLSSFVIKAMATLKTGDRAASNHLCAWNVSPSTSKVTSVPFFSQRRLLRCLCRSDGGTVTVGQADVLSTTVSMDVEHLMTEMSHLTVKQSSLRHPDSSRILCISRASFFGAAVPGHRVSGLIEQGEAEFERKVGVIAMDQFEEEGDAVVFSRPPTAVAVGRVSDPPAVAGHLESM